MFTIEYEVVAKYSGSINKIEEDIGVEVEILGCNYAIITSNSKRKIRELLNYPDIISHIESPFLLERQEIERFSSEGLEEFKKNNKLSGKGTILGIIDSEINYDLDILKDVSGKSKILYYWNQSDERAPYTNQEINKAINGDLEIPIEKNTGNNEDVHRICYEIANDSNIIFVKIRNVKNSELIKSTDLMRAIKFILNKSLELEMPVAISINYVTNEVYNKDISLFEQYIDDMCLFWKNNIVVAPGNNDNKYCCKEIAIKDKKVKAEFNIVEGETLLDLDICSDFIDEFSVYLVSPSNIRTRSISLTSGEVKNIIGTTKIKGYFYPISPYSLLRKVRIQMSSKTSIEPGKWKIVFVPIDIVSGDICIYLKNSFKTLKNTKFIKPNKNPFKFIPQNTSKVIHSYPYMAGILALFMQWGIVEKNDLYLYSQKLKASILKLIKQNSNNLDSLNRYNELDLSNVNLDNIFKKDREKMIGNIDLQSEKFSRGFRREYSNQASNVRYGINIIHDGNFEEDMQSLGIPYEYYKISERFGVVFILPEYQRYVPDIFNFESVITYQINIRLSLLGEISQGTSQGITANEEIGANFFKNNPNVSITGRGVVICIADSGIDYLHEDFIYPDGTSKIRYLWDQTKEGNPPEGFSIGTEYTREDINNAIANKDASLSIDEEGHGTMISGICSGMGRLNSEYPGVAEDSELIVVKLSKIGGYYTNASLIAATEYFNKKSYDENIPIIINYSLGGNMPGRTSSTVIGSTFFVRGMYTVAAAGNEGNTQTHTSGRLQFNGEIKDIELELLEEEDTLDIDILMDKPDLVTVGVVSPIGEQSKLLIETDYTPVTGLFDFEGTRYSISYIYPTNYSGQELVRVNLNNVKRGIWRIRLVGNYITSGVYQAYLPNRVFLKPGTKFRNPDPLYTINYPATYDENISVGAYDTINNSMWVKSSRGPTIAGTYKPDIVAPGVNIIAPYPGNTYATITGTAPASAYVAGSAALYMQYVLVDGIYPTKSFSQKIKTYLKAGAKRSADISYPNGSYGYGILDIRGVFEQLK